MSKRLQFFLKKEIFGLFSFLTIGFILRLWLSSFVNRGDIEVFAEWGKRFWDLGAKNYYLDQNWYWSRPVYPPISSLMYAALYWLYDHRYVLAEIHNFVKVIPSSFIIHFSRPVPGDPFLWGYGYYLLIKFPSILGDIGISILIYLWIRDLTKDTFRAFLGLTFYLLNPITIFLSSFWGQSEGLISFFGLLAFYLLYLKKVELSIPCLLLSLYLKPNWIIALPAYVAYFFKIKPLLKMVSLGVAIATVIFVATTYPFSGKNLLGFTLDTTIRNSLPGEKGTSKATISAFNFYAIFFDIDKTKSSDNIFGFSLNSWSLAILVSILTAATLRLFRVKGIKEFLLLTGVTILGEFLFMVNMLERYFFAALPFLLIAVFCYRKFYRVFTLMNMVFFLNLVWAFYRRTNGEIDRIFTQENFLLIRLLSLLLFMSWGYLFIRVFGLRKSFIKL